MGKSSFMVSAEKSTIICIETLQQNIHTREASELFFSLLEEAGFGLDYFNHVEPINIPFSTNAASEMWTKGKSYESPQGEVTSNTFFGRHSNPKIDVTVSWSTIKNAPALSRIELCLSKVQFKKGQADFVNLFRQLIHSFNPIYAFVGSEAATYRQQGALWQHFPGVYWLNFFGAEYVDFIGHSHILACDWVQSEVLSNGILTWSTPSFDVSEKDFMDIEEIFREQLGLQLFATPTSKYASSVPATLLEIRTRIAGKTPSSPSTELLLKLAEKKLNKST